MRFETIELGVPGPPGPPGPQGPPDTGPIDPSRITIVPATALGYVKPENYGPWDASGATDNLATLLAAQQAASALGYWIDGSGATCGIVGTSALGWDVVGGLKLRDMTLKDIRSGTRSNRNLLRAVGVDRVWMERVKIDRNGDGLGTGIHSAYIQNVEDVALHRCDVSGNDAGSGMWINACQRVDVFGNYIHDIYYVHSAQTDDQVVGIFFQLCDYVKCIANRVYRLGRTDQTAPDRDWLSRGIALSGCSGVLSENAIYRAAAAFDVTGSATNSRLIVSNNNLEDLIGIGVKFANTGHGNVVTGNRIHNVGFAGVNLSPGNGPFPNVTSDILISGNQISGVGWCKLYDSLTPGGIKVTVGDDVGITDKDPRGVIARGNLITAETRSSVFETVATDTVGVKTTVVWVPGQRVRLTTTGTLPAPLATATDYWVILQQDTGSATYVGGNVKLATSFIHAQDGVAITGLTGGSGVHTLTQQSDMQFGGLCQPVPYVDTPNVWGSDNVVRGAIQAGNQGWHHVGREMGTSTPGVANTTLPTGTFTQLVLTSIAETGIGAMATSGVITCKRTGKYRATLEVEWDANTSGTRAIRFDYSLDGGANWFSQGKTLDRRNADVTGTTMQRTWLEIVLSAGNATTPADMLRVMGQHTVPAATLGCSIRLTFDLMAE